MCTVRVSLRRGRTSEQLAILSKAIDDALVEGYGMARGDTFQIFEQLDPDEFVYDRDYMGGPRSDDFLMLSIVGGPTPEALKRSFYARLVELLAERAAVRPQDVFVGMQDAPAVNWSFSGGKALEIPRS